MLLDTSGLYSYLDADDGRHATAADYLHAARRRVTHSYVLAELVALGRARRLRSDVLLGFVRDIADSAEVEIVWVGDQEHRAATALLLDRPDKSYSLCDGVSFVLMQRLGVRDALTTDHHFEQEGYRRLLPG